VTLDGEFSLWSFATGQGGDFTMGSFSIFHWLIVIAIIAAIVMVLKRVGGRSASGQSATDEHVTVQNKQELLGKVQFYATKGFQTVMDRGSVIVMSRRIPFNWVLFIVLLFIPIIGWIALLILIFANKNKVQTITIESLEAAS
jgi:hypothetical protein